MIRLFFLLFIVLLCCNPQRAHAGNSSFNYLHFQTLPVLHEGRLKPLDSLARLYMKEFSGRDQINNMDAAAWMAETLFDPAQAVERKIFLIRSIHLKQILDLTTAEKYFSLIELQPGLQKTLPQLEPLLKADPESLTAEQHELLQIHEHSLAYMQVLRSLSIILPLDIILPEKYGKDLGKDRPSYADLAKIEKRLASDIKNLLQEKGGNLDHYTDEEKKLAQLGFQLEMFHRAAVGNDILRILPVSWDGTEDTWISPWLMAQQKMESPESRDYLDFWKRMAMAYRNGNAEEWNNSTKETLRYIQLRGGADLSLFELKLEIIYNRIKPFQKALLLYLLGAFLLAIALSGKKFAVRPAVICSSLALAIHAGGILIRMRLLDRPPVGTLYESVLFVSLVCALIAFSFLLRSRNFITALSGTSAAAILLLIAPYALQQGESMEMLVAVLNTNFWLATHVLCITAGYGICVITACMAHAHLILRLREINQNILQNLQQNIYRMSVIALLFTCIGTILGGIWADQSWGRFWGWDPKENGALLIVLWLIWLQHGRLSGHLGTLHFIAGAAFLNVIVALAWFGVNLLNVGLHSYGFTSGMAAGLGAFCTAEILLIAALLFAIRHKERTGHVV